MRLFCLAALVGSCLLAFTSPASAQLMLVAGPNEGNQNPNNYGWAGGGVDSPGEVAALFVFSTSGISTYFDSSVGPYDGADDTQVGVKVLSGATIHSLSLTGTTNVFGFDGDGITTYGAPGNTSDTSGYGGPITFFTNINGAMTSGTANFIGGLAPGSSTFFSLEGPPSSIGTVTPMVPEPSSLLMAAISTIGMAGYYAVRRRRNLRTA
jgi:PEP-CTERM motif